MNNVKTHTGIDTPAMIADRFNRLGLGPSEVVDLTQLPAEYFSNVIFNTDLQMWEEFTA